MQLDFPTFLFTNVVVLFGAATTGFLAWRRHREQQGLEEWSIAMATAGAGAVMLALFGPIPPIALGVFAGSLVIAGFLAFWESVRRFNGRTRETGRVVLMSLAFCVVYGAVWYFGADLRLRTIFASLALAGCAMLAGGEVLSGRRSEPLSGRFFTAAIFALVAIVMLIRALGAAWLPPSIGEEAFFDDPVQGYTMFGMTIGLACLSFGGVSFMAHERLLHRYETLAATDELTRLPNRRAFLEQALRLSQRARQEGTLVSVLGLDLDYFRKVNDRFGHAGGDQALIALAGVMREHLRPTDLVGRCGGEEFSVLLADTDLAGAREIAERLRLAVAGLRLDIDGEPLTFTVSIGVAAMASHDLHEAMKQADEALYRAKHAGRNRVVVAGDEATLATA